MRISRQLKHSAAPDDVHNLYFGVKFYAADPCKLIEEITRYQLYLQVKQDVLQGRLPVSFELASELGAFVVQCEYSGRSGTLIAGKGKGIQIEIHYSLLLISFGQLNWAIMTDDVTRQGTCPSSGWCRIKPKNWSSAFPRSISSSRGSRPHRQSSSI